MCSTTMVAQTEQKKTNGRYRFLARVATCCFLLIAAVVTTTVFFLEPDDPGAFGEDVNDVASKQLKRIAEFLEGSTEIDLPSLNEIASNDFRCESLRPTTLAKIFDDGQVSISRTHQPEEKNEATTAGPNGLQVALAQLKNSFRDSNDVHAKFKIFHVDRISSQTTTTANLHVQSVFADGAMEQTSTWICHWRAEPDGKHLKLERIELKQFEEVLSQAKAGTLFPDRTAAVLGDSEAYNEQLARGIDYWRERIPKEIDIDFQGHHGISIGDVNGDHLDDVYVCQPPGLPNRLFIQNPDGTARDVSVAAGVDWLDDSIAALLIDLDNDGDQDLIIGQPNKLLVMSNNGKGQFSLQSTPAISEWTYSLSAADYDNDGDLDIYVCGFGFFGKTNRGLIQGAVHVPTPYHDANNGVPNILLRNEGNWRFVDVTAETGIDENNTRFSHAASWEDFDNDGDLDVYVANDYGRNNLYQNDNGKFRDVAAELGVEDLGPGMSVTWSDFNLDGRMDLYVSNMFSSAGGRITSHHEFQRNLSEQERKQFQRHARGNSLFVNRTDGSFDDVSLSAGVTMGRWAWSSNFIDINNDGLDDLFVANGYITNENSDDL